MDPQGVHGSQLLVDRDSELHARFYDSLGEQPSAACLCRPPFAAVLDSGETRPVVGVRLAALDREYRHATRSLS
jgi:hypothetical protein